jgi:hypothetical protein
MSASDEACRLAQNLARNCGYCCFPCGEDKRPTLKGWPERASTGADAIHRMWVERPGPLVGIVCGEASGIDVLDLDVKHDAARAWYAENRHRLPTTRIFRTRSGGAHLYFRHAIGVRSSAGKIADGVDVRAAGGFAVSWWCAGLECLNHAPVAPWPTWLLTLILPPPPKPAERRHHTAPHNPDAAIDGILRAVSGASQGQRNATLNWAAYHLGERVAAGEVGRSEAETLLIEAAHAAGLLRAEAIATIHSGLKGAGA